MAEARLNSWGLSNAGGSWRKRRGMVSFHQSRFAARPGAAILDCWPPDVHPARRAATVSDFSRGWAETHAHRTRRQPRTGTGCWLSGTGCLRYGAPFWPPGFCWRNSNGLLGQRAAPGWSLRLTSGDIRTELRRRRSPRYPPHPRDHLLAHSDLTSRSNQTRGALASRSPRALAWAEAGSGFTTSATSQDGGLLVGLISSWLFESGRYQLSSLRITGLFTPSLCWAGHLGTD